MDAIEILGSLLGGGSQSKPSSSGAGGSGGLSGKILGELLGAATGRSSEPAPRSQPSRGGSVSHRPVDVQSESRRLEDLLGVATGKNRGGVGAAPQSSAPQYQPSGPSLSPSRSSSSTASQPRFDPEPARQPTAPSSEVSQQEEALALVRAMINAAKADGKVDEKEQEIILSRVPNDPQTIQFLRQELAKPLDVRDFAWNVPLGLEVQVYTISLATINLDSKAEGQYLRELAHGLRLDPDLVNQIHTRYGAPTIF